MTAPAARLFRFPIKAAAFAAAFFAFVPGMAGAVTPAARCRPLPGAAQLWVRPQTRFVMFGEVHGAAEIAPLVADTVCIAAQRRPVALALELDETLQPAVDDFLTSDGGPAALDRLGASGEWTDHSDGRVSEALIALLQRMRVFRQTGLPVEVRLVDSQRRDPLLGRDGTMAANLAAIVEGRPDVLVISLGGNAHARRLQRFGGGRLRLSAAAILGRDRTVSLDLDGVGGSAWFCAEDACGPHVLDPVVGVSPRGVRRARPDESVEVDFYYSPGAPLSPAAPVGFVPRR